MPETKCSNCGGGFADDDKPHKYCVCGYSYHFGCFFSTDKNLLCELCAMPDIPEETVENKD